MSDHETPCKFHSGVEARLHGHDVDIVALETKLFRLEESVEADLKEIKMCLLSRLPKGVVIALSILSGLIGALTTVLGALITRGS